MRADEERRALERQLAFSHLGGRAGAFEQVVETLLDRAGTAFSQDQDADAAVYRTLAKQFQQWAKEARREQAQHDG